MKFEQQSLWQKSNFEKMVCLTLLVIMSILYIQYVHKYGVNLPRSDDYGTAFGFLISWHDAANWHDKWVILLAQQNEHRILLTKFLEVLTYNILGHINFAVLLWMANIFLFLITIFVSYVTTRLLPDSTSKWSMLVIVVALLLSPLQWQSQLWGMAGIEALGQILCSLLILYCFARYIEEDNKRDLLFLIVLSFLNMFIAGGFLAMFVTLPIMALIFRKGKLSLFLIGYFFLLSILFFKIIPYKMTPHPMPTLESAIQFFFAFWAGGFNIFHNQHSMQIGALVMIYFLFCRKEIMNNKFIFSWVVFCFMIDFLLVRTRGTWGALGGLGSRYNTYSLLAVTLTIPLLLRYSVISDSWKLIENIIYYVGKVFFTQKQCALQEESAKQKRPYLEVIFLIALICFGSFMVTRNQKAYVVEYRLVKTTVFYPLSITHAISLYETAKDKGIYSSKRLDSIIAKEKAQNNL